MKLKSKVWMAIVVVVLGMIAFSKGDGATGRISYRPQNNEYVYIYKGYHGSISVNSYP